MAENTSRFSRWANASRHPVLLLLLGTLLSSWLIPGISSRTARARLLQEARFKKASDILAQSVTADRQLNALLTTFEAFHKDALEVPTVSRGAQAEIRKTAAELYRDFDRHGWWWFHDLDVHANLLGIGSERNLKRIEDCTARYRANLLLATETIDKVWHTIVSDGYRPTRASVGDTLRESRLRFARLMEERGAIVREMAGVFFSPD